MKNTPLKEIPKPMATFRCKQCGLVFYEEFDNCHYTVMIGTYYARCPWCHRVCVKEREKE